MTSLIILCGIPGSGKTTISEQLSVQYNAKLYHYDEFVKQFTYADKGKTHSYLYKTVASDLLNNHNVVIDDLHTRLEWRRELLDALKDVSCTKILVVVNTPLEECLRRNAKRSGSARLPDSIIEHLHKTYEPPTIDEGWDEIMHV